MAGNEPQFTAEKAGIKFPEINLESVSGLFFDVNRYNQENSPNAIIAKAITASIKASYPPTENNSNIPALLRKFTLDTKESLAQRIREKVDYFKAHKKILLNDQKEIINFKNSISAQQIRQEDYFNDIPDYYETLLEQLGLSIQKTNTPKTIKLTTPTSDNDEDKIEFKGIRPYIPFKKVEFESSEIIYNIENGEKFISFLNALDSESLEDDFKKGLINILDSLSYQLTDRYDFSNPSQQALEFKTNIEQIISQYRRLGMGDITESLEIYYEHLKMGVLKDFLTLEESNFFINQTQEPLNPDTWQNKYSPEAFQNMWDTAFDILVRAKNNPNAKGFYYNLKTFIFPKAIDDFFDKIEQADFIPENNKMYYAYILILIEEQLKKS